MFNEKAAAFFEGVAAAHLKTMDVAMSSLTGQLKFTDFTTLSVQIASAACGPAFRAVRANSKRLTVRTKVG